MPNKVRNHQSGFMALIAVILLASGTMAVSLAVLASAAEYSDSVTAHELRIQKRLNEAACLDTARLMIAKDVFLKERVEIPEFRCVVDVVNGEATIVTIKFP